MDEKEAIILEPVKKKKWSQWILNGIAAIALGILGSALWEWIFRPIFSSTGRLIIDGYLSLDASYRDRFYEKVIYGVPLERYITSAVFLMALLVPFTFSVINRMISAYSYNKTAEQRAKYFAYLDNKYWKWASALFLAFYMVASTDVDASRQHTKMINVIQLLPQDKAEEIKSEFVKIKSSKEYSDLYTKARKYLNENYDPSK